MKTEANVVFFVTQVHFTTAQSRAADEPWVSFRAAVAAGCCSKYKQTSELSCETVFPKDISERRPSGN